MKPAGNKGEERILFAETYGDFMATSCPSGANAPKAVTLLKTKDRKRQFSCTKAVRILKKSRLQKSMEIWN
jgi:hypothetical protein